MVTQRVTSTTDVLIVAGLNQSVQTGSLHVSRPINVVSAAFDPQTVTGGLPASLTVALNGPAPWALCVGLSASDASLITTTLITRIQR